MRYFDDKQIYNQIKNLIDAGVKKLKFVDRTFNLKPSRMKTLMEWLSQFIGSEFHFEVVGDILTPDILRFLETVPPGMFQFEIGIQTIDESVQESIDRKQNNQKLFDTIKTLLVQDRIHFHCDLIFGLPGENMEKILNSFRDIFDRFYNSKRFRFCIAHILKNMDPVTLFDRLLHHHESNNLFMNPVSLDTQYEIFQQPFFANPSCEEKDLLKLDYLYSQRAYRLPAFLSEKSLFSGNTWKQELPL